MKIKFFKRIMAVFCATAVLATFETSIGAIKANTKNVALFNKVKEVNETINSLKNALEAYGVEETLKVCKLLEEIDTLDIGDYNKLFLFELEKSIKSLTQLMGCLLDEQDEDIEKIVKLESKICYQNLKKLKENPNDFEIAVRIGFEDAIRLKPRQNFNDDILKEYQNYYDAGYENGSGDIYKEKLKSLITKIYYSNDPIEEKMEVISKILKLRKNENYIDRAKVIIDVLNPLYLPEDRHQRAKLKDALVECIKAYIDEDMKMYENFEPATSLVEYIQKEKKNEIANRVAGAVISSTFKNKFDSIGKLELLIYEQLFDEKENFKVRLNKIESSKIYKHELNYITRTIKTTLEQHNEADAQKILIDLISSTNQKFTQIFRRFANVTTGENTNIESTLRNVDLALQNIEMDEIDHLNDVLKNHPQLEKIRDSFCKIVDEISGIDVDQSKSFNERILAAVDEFQSNINLYVNSIK